MTNFVQNIYGMCWGKMLKYRENNGSEGEAKCKTAAKDKKKVTKFLLIAVGCIVLAWFIHSFFVRKKKSSAAKRCSVCGAESKYGYSEKAEEKTKNIRSMCMKCLVSQLKDDYTTFSARAVVIQPVPGVPCYVFHSNRDWGESFKESKMDDDTRVYLLRMDALCHDCGQKANFLWIESRGFTAHNFGTVLRKGFSEALLPRNPKPIPLCGRCCVNYIAEELREKEITYLEVSGPKGGEDGFVIPMAYWPERAPSRGRI